MDAGTIVLILITIALAVIIILLMMIRHARHNVVHVNEQDN